MSSTSQTQTRNARYYNAPLSPEVVETWFDADGRLVKEAEMRKALFEVGVHSSCRAKLFKFLFKIYPINSTTRDRKSIDIENRANYIALRRRWEVMDRTITLPDDDLIQGIWYMDLSDDEDGDDSNSRPPQPEAMPTKVVPPTRSDAVGSSKANTLTESRDSGNFTETSAEDEGIDGTATESCSHCAKRGGDTITRNVGQPSGKGENRESPQLHHHNGNADRGSPFVTTTATTANSTSCEYCCEGGTVRGGVASLGDPPSSQSSPSPLLSSKGGVAEGASENGPKRRRSTSGVLDEEGQAVLKILEFPAKVYAARLSVELEKSYPKAKRIILRDVSRTDRNYHFFSHKKNLRRVHRILMIYSLFHPEIGYAQGMNDILARFLVVTDSEVDSYWLFARYMDAKRNDFLEDTMMAKVGLVKNLIYELDSNLYEFFENSECRDYLFCHRWLLLDFKREFPFEESIRVFEILSSHYLELDSHRAMRETHKVIAKEFELDGGEMRAERSSVNLGFTFDLFICAAILTMSNSDVIAKGTDAASIYGHLNSLSMNLDLKRVLSTAEELFYKYCKLTVTRGFSEIQL